MTLLSKRKIIILASSHNLENWSVSFYQINSLAVSLDCPIFDFISVPIKPSTRLIDFVLLSFDRLKTTVAVQPHTSVFGYIVLVP